MPAVSRGLLAILLLVLPCAAAAQPAAVHPEPPAAPRPAGLSRWIDAQAAAIAVRYRRIETSGGQVSSSEVQESVALRGRFKFDAEGRVALTAGVATGGGLTSGWNSTGVGTGEFSGRVWLKQLFLSVTPLQGVEVEYGGLSAVRGEATEVTHLDNDTYLVGQRLVVRRPGSLWIDEAAVTLAYLGDATNPSFLRRTHRLSEVNYHQYLAGKKLGRYARVSVEYGRYRAVGTVRGAVVLRWPRLRVIDLARFEQYRRMGPAPGNGFGVHVEKRLGRRWVLAGGFADIDRAAQVQNGDRYLRGRHLYSLTTVSLGHGVSASVYLTHSVATRFAIPNRFRGEAVLGYNALPLVRRLLGGA